MKEMQSSSTTTHSTLIVIWHANTTIFQLTGGETTNNLVVALGWGEHSNAANI
jgi:hypothetical protein